ncbi:DUF4349 domain-containing protein [Parvularcula lutaonensis]|uniref:DUF4349 domain-containing protein n=1 Tax=Parvularcula lutaonensis TaxID=491923 RepID=A0ABV7MBE9_9PROT|nr:DUF4349 domain-containing protein [Parvularcula lutaonensis]GGY40265.1 hypothetical protein GCM10007148_05930 [Parvularcula lutaonensis]
MRFMTAFAAMLALGACNDDGAYNAQQPVYAELAEEADTVAVTGARLKSGAPPTEQGGEPSATRYLAYAYSGTLLLPSESVKPVLSRHEEACIAAGPSTCQVLESSVEERNADSVFGTLSFRATRDYMNAFRAGLAAEAEAVKGSVVSMNASVEDLTREILDTSARLEAQRKLRDRLLVLLEKDTDDVGDLLQVERELARVQSEIESTESWLRALEGRVSMDRMTLSYQSIRKPVTQSTGQPLAEAFRNFFYVVSESLAAVILFVAAALPWLIVAIPALFLLRFAINRIRRKP